MDKCRVCAAEDLKTFTAKEMMFGLRETFEYQECNSCRSLQIKEIPQDLSKYYPSNYNAYHKGKQNKDNLVKRYLKKKMASEYLNNRHTMLSNQLIKSFGLGYVEKMKPSNVTFESKILDVGTGNGARLLGLHKYGFNNLTGIEPFIENDIFYENGVKVYAQDIYNHEGKYDLIMFNHVFEHVPDPRKVLERVHHLLANEGSIQISIPVADSEAYSIYKENWVALDPPRHLHVFSKKGIRGFVKESGFEVYDELYDGSAYQFWGSEQYKKDIPLRSENSYYSNKEDAIFSKEEIIHFQEKAKTLNKEKKGDTACFYIKRISN